MESQPSSRNRGCIRCGMHIERVRKMTEMMWYPTRVKALASVCSLIAGRAATKRFFFTIISSYPEANERKDNHGSRAGSRLLSYDAGRVGGKLFHFDHCLGEYEDVSQGLSYHFDYFFLYENLVCREKEGLVPSCILHSTFVMLRHAGVGRRGSSKCDWDAS